jgi:hypothetical protein
MNSKPVWDDEAPTTRRDTPKAMQAVKAPSARKVQRHTFTYGTLPSRELFDFRFEEEVNQERRYKGLFSFVNDERLGTEKLTNDELWAEIVKATAEYDQRGNESAGAWVSSVLSCLGIEWI